MMKFKVRLCKGYDPQSKGNKIDIVDIETDELIVRHHISTKRGELVQIVHPERDILNSVDEVYGKAFTALGKTDNAKKLLDNIRREKARYCKDQFGAIINAASSYEAKIINQAVDYCVVRSLWSAGMLKDAFEYFEVSINAHH